MRAVRPHEHPGVSDVGTLRAHPGWKQRKPPSGGYNCAGMVWAARRTCIEESDAIRIVFEDDGLRRLGAAEAPVIGDLAYYFLQEGAPFEDFLHVGMVAAEGQGIVQEACEAPVLIVSKFNSSFGEVLHALHDVPWSFPHQVEFWTDRP